MPAVPIQNAFQLAFQHHQAGCLADAEALYRQVLAVQPQHAEALHLLGVVAHQEGRHERAAELIERALTLAPTQPTAHSNLGEAYRALGRLDDAIVQYTRALQLQPDYPEARNNLGLALARKGRFEEAIAAYREALRLSPGRAEIRNNLGVALAGNGRRSEAIAAYRWALQLRPEYPEAHNNLGNALAEEGQADEAIAAYRRALEIRPDYGEAHHNLGVALTGKGELDHAVAAFRRALELKPDYVEAGNNLGLALTRQGRLDEAVATFHRTLASQPEYAQAHNNLGMALVELGRLDEATATFRQAIALEPDYSAPHNNLGLVLASQGRSTEAIAAYQRALQLLPDCEEAQSNLGTALAERGELDAALAAHTRAIQLNPRSPKAHNNLGITLKERGEIDEAVATFRRALELRPEEAGARSNLIYTLHFHPGDDGRMLALEQDRWNRQFSTATPWTISTAPNRAPERRLRVAERRLRVGYVSPDFRDHVVGRNLAPLFRCHDRNKVEIVCYSGVVQPDHLTDEFHQRADLWRSTLGVKDEALAEMIRQDGVDILVDLTQHMAGNRLPVFARRPAPVQVSFAGYPASTGVEAIGYRISDRWLEAESGDRNAEIGWKHQPALPSSISPLPPAEQVCLIESFWCYDPCGLAMDVPALPALKNGRITFGSLNNFCKVNEAVLKLWAQVLRQVEGARLILMSPRGSHRLRIWEILQREGIEPDRVELVGRRSRRDYFALYHRLDVVLDPFPYGGHTTSLDALWMGVPVVSLAGKTPVSRAGRSILSNLGLPELATPSAEDYVRIAVDLAGDISRLAELRTTLRSRMEASVLMDAPRFAHGVEAAYRAMWRQWCASGKTR